MPKSSRNRPNGRITVTPFRFALNQFRTTGGTSYTETDLTTTNLGGRIADLAYDFEYFRLTKLTAYSCATLDAGGVAAGVAVLHGVAFDITPAAFVITPTSVSRLMAFRHASLAPKEMRPSIVVRAKEFGADRPMRWYHTQATGSPDASESSAGTLYSYLEVAASGTLTNAVNQYVVVEGICEFMEPVDPTLSRARRGDVQIPPAVRAAPPVVAMLARLQKVVEAEAEDLAKSEATQK